MEIVVHHADGLHRRRVAECLGLDVGLLEGLHLLILHRRYLEARRVVSRQDRHVVGHVELVRRTGIDEQLHQRVAVANRVDPHRGGDRPALQQLLHRQLQLDLGDVDVAHGDGDRRRGPRPADVVPVAIDVERVVVHRVEPAADVHHLVAVHHVVRQRLDPEVLRHLARGDDDHLRHVQLGAVGDLAQLVQHLQEDGQRLAEVAAAGNGHAEGLAVLVGIAGGRRQGDVHGHVARTCRGRRIVGVVGLEMLVPAVHQHHDPALAGEARDRHLHPLGPHCRPADGDVRVIVERPQQHIVGRNRRVQRQVN